MNLNIGMMDAELVPIRDAMNVDDPLIHPDSPSTARYCMGTGLQMRDGSSSHRSKLCAYHDVSLCADGKMLRTMVQEALQIERKFRTIQQVNA